MKTSNRSRVLVSLLTGGLVLTLTKIATPTLSAQEQADVIAPLGTVATPTPAPTESAPAMRYSPGTAEIVKMVDAKVDPQVIKAYIKNSPTAYNPTASEIIALKEHGVSDDILTAMMQRGGEVRAQGAASGQPASPPMAAPGAYAPGPTPAPAYGYDYAPASYADYGYGYPYPYSYSYPYNYWWYNNYGYPWSYYSPFFFGVYGFPFHHGHNGFHVHDGHFNSPGHNGFVHSGQPWAPVRSGGHSFVSGNGGGFRSAGAFSGRSSAFAVHSGGFAGRSSGSFAMRGGGFHSGGGSGGRSGGGFSGHSGGHR